MNSSLQDYEVLKVVGSGSFGTCYKVRNVLTSEIFVWKAVDYGRMSEEKKKLLCNEVNTLSEISHPYIVKYFSRILHKDTTTLYIIMEWCQGGDLASVIKETYKLGKLIEEWYIWRVVYQLARALEHLHQEHALAHRDVKAANIFLDSRGNVKLGDFGLSCTVSINPSSQAVTVGTLHYVSPEILKGSQYGFKSDIWSFGCLVYEMCSLSPPFHGTGMAQIISNIKAGRFQRIPSNYSEGLSKIVNSMLTVAMDLRPSARVITRHPAVVANQVSSNADFTPSSSSSGSIGLKSESSSNRHDMTRRIGEIRISDEPEDVSKKIFKDKWLAKLESVRSKEAKLREKADKLVEREHSLDRREKRLALLERQAKEKMARANVYLNRCKESKTHPDLNETDASFSADPGDTSLPITIAKLDPQTLPKPNFGCSKKIKHVHFQNQNTSGPKVEKKSTELSIFHLSNSVNENDRQTTIKGLRYSSCQIVKRDKENKKPSQTLKRNSVSRLSVRSSNIIV